MRKSALWLAVFLFLSTACTPGTARPGTKQPAASSPATPHAAAETCTYFQKTAPTPKGPSLFPPVSAQDHVRGPADAYLTITVYSDFQCPLCAKFAALLVQVQQKYPQDIRIVYRDFPLITKNDKAALSTQAAEAANLQGKFWEMHDALFAKQSEWTALDPARFQLWAIKQASALGLDPVRFQTDLNSPAIVAIPKQAWQDGLKIQLPGVPLILINDEILKWQPTLLNDFTNIVRLDLLSKRQFKTCPLFTIDPTRQYQATLKTSRGDIVIRLFAGTAPNTVNNFIFLAQAGWYDNITFYRVVPGSIVQTGDPSETGQGNPGYFIPDEIDPSLKYDRAGLVGMNNSGPDTNGSQFFITSKPAPALNGTYTAFGQVISGMDVLQKLTPRDGKPGDNLPDGDLLITVLIEEK